MKAITSIILDSILISTISISTYTISTYKDIRYSEPVRNSEPSTNFHAPSASSSTPVPLPPQSTNRKLTLADTPSTPLTGPKCNQKLWDHIYNKGRLKVLKPCISVTGTFVDASAGRFKDGCRHEKDGDSHCWLKLDAGWERLLAPNNIREQDGNLVFELICRYPVHQADTIAQGVCTNFHQSPGNISLPPLNSYIKITGSWVFDTAHQHNEIHPVTSIQILPTPPSNSTSK